MRRIGIPLLLICLAGCNGPEPVNCPDPDRAEAAFAALELVPEANTVKAPEWKAERLRRFLDGGAFRTWCYDSYPTGDDRRLTGPFIGRRDVPAQAAADRAVYNGLTTHAQVRIYYSKAMVRWLRHGRRGRIPDGATMVKEMYPVPRPRERAGEPDGWAVMVRDNAASRDGWLWFLYYRKGNLTYEREFEAMKYGLGFCLSCHASTDLDSATFAYLGNLTGNDVVTFVRLGSLVGTPDHSSHGDFGNQYDVLSRLMYRPLLLPRDTPNPDLLAAYGIDAEAIRPPAALPMDGFFDHIVAPPPGAAPRLLTATQCSGCHDASDLVNQTYAEMTVSLDPELPTPYDPNCDREGRDVCKYWPTPFALADLAPYGEWKGSLMSISARDPVFRAQLEYELRDQPPARREEIARDCLGCHAPMAARALPTLAADPANLDACPLEPPDPADPERPGYSEEAALSGCAVPFRDEGQERVRFGALGRDGVSCMICHTMEADGLGTPATFSGKFVLGPADNVYGPYPEVVSLPMQHAIGVTPAPGDHVAASGLCGSCHMLEVGVYDGETRIGHEWEQTTFWEWERSRYPAEGKTCQSCHMPERNPFTGAPTEGRIANVEDSQFPYAPNRAAPEALDATSREGYRRHSLHGINLFTMGFFQQFPGFLGSSTVFPNRAGNVLPPKVLALRESLAMARSETARIELSELEPAGQGVAVEVTVTNLAGHNLPTGVQFRRAYLEVQAFDADGTPQWCSGCSDAAGLIVADGRPLPSELTYDPGELEPDRDVIESEDEVQIYESRYADCQGRLTTSFLRLCRGIKENRLLPLGYVPGEVSSAALTQIGVTRPSPPGTDQVRYVIPASNVARIEVRLVYQPLPPFYLADRFAPLAQGAELPAASALLFFVSHLDLDHDTLPLRNWQLPIACAARSADGSVSDCLPPLPRLQTAHGVH